VVEKANIIARVKERHAQAGGEQAWRRRAKCTAALPVGHARDNIRKTAKTLMISYFKSRRRPHHGNCACER